MSQVSLEIDKSAYKPRETLQVSVTWSTIESLGAELTLKLLWHTEGFGTVDHEIIEERIVSRSSDSGTAVVEFQLPGEPLSVHGTYVSILWCVELSAGKTLLERKSFILSPSLSPIEVPREKVE